MMSNEPLYSDPDRPRGILTESDREYILARGEGYSRQAAHARRKRIPERLVHGILDLALLSDLPADERQELFITEDDDKAFQAADARQEIRAALSFLYQFVDDLEGDFEALLADAIVQAEHEPDNAEVIFRTAEVNISEPETFDIEEIVEIVENPSMLDELSRQELFFLIVMAYDFGEQEHRETYEAILQELSRTLYEHWLDPEFVEPFYDRQLGDE